MSYKIIEVIIYDNCRGKTVHRERVKGIEFEKRSDVELYRETLRLKYIDKVPGCGDKEPDPQVYFVTKNLADNGRQN